jgi:hypothetical protein
MDNHALSGIRTHDPSVRASEDSSCLRQRGHCDRHKSYIVTKTACVKDTTYQFYFNVIALITEFINSHVLPFAQCRPPDLQHLTRTDSTYTKCYVSPFCGRTLTVTYTTPVHTKKNAHFTERERNYGTEA